MFSVVCCRHPNLAATTANRCLVEQLTDHGVRILDQSLRAWEFQRARKSELHWIGILGTASTILDGGWWLRAREEADSVCVCVCARARHDSFVPTKMYSYMRLRRSALSCTDAGEQWLQSQALPNEASHWIMQYDDHLVTFWKE